MVTGSTRGVCQRIGRPAFTLVELLVVMAILSLLLSLLMPALTRTKAMARRTQCQANLRQIHAAATSYHSANNGALVAIHPPVKMPENGGDEAWVEPPPGWMQRHPQWPNTDKFCYNDMLRQYVGGGVETKLTSGGVRGDEPLWQCPSAFETRNNAWNHRQLDYGINHYGRGTGETGKYWDSMSGRVEGRSEGNHPRVVSNIGRTTGIWFSDAENDVSPEDIGGISRGKLAAEGGDHWPITVSFDVYAYIRHMMGYNAVQLDGTVVWYDGERIDPDLPAADRAELARRKAEKWFIYKPGSQG